MQSAEKPEHRSRAIHPLPTTTLFHSDYRTNPRFHEDFESRGSFGKRLAGRVCGNLSGGVELSRREADLRETLPAHTCRRWHA